MVVAIAGCQSLMPMIFEFENVKTSLRLMSFAAHLDIDTFSKHIFLSFYNR